MRSFLLYGRHSEMDTFRARDLAWQLAEHQLPGGSPLVFQKEQEFRDYLYFLIQVNKPLQLLRRIAAGLLAFRAYGELRTILRQRRILQLGASEDTHSRIILDAIRAEVESRWRGYFGRAASARIASVYDALPDHEQRIVFARLLRGGYVLETPSGFECTHLKERLRAAKASAVIVFTWQIWILYALSQQSAIEGAFAVAFIIASAVLAGWIGWTLRSGVFEAQATAATANETLRPRRAL